MEAQSRKIVRTHGLFTDSWTLDSDSRTLGSHSRTLDSHSQTLGLRCAYVTDDR